MSNSKRSIPEKFANWYIPLIYRNKFKALSFYLCIALACSFTILVYPGLKLDADLSKLLPDSTPSVIALKESFNRFGSTDRFMIAIQSENVDVVAELQDSIKAYIMKNWQGDFVTVQVDNDNKFFKDNALLYLPVVHLERIRDNLEEVQLEIGRKNLPFVVDLVQKEEKAERIWFDANIPQELGLPDEAASAFDAFFKTEENDTVPAKSASWDTKAPVPERFKTRLIGCPRPDSTGKILFNGVVQAKLLQPATDYVFVGHILARSDTLMQYFNSKKYAAPVRFSVEGTYEGLKEVDDLQNDSITSFAIGFVLILFITIWFFRSIKGPIIIISSILYACVLTLAFVSVFYGILNPFTVFVATIILGIGIDYSIHILGTAQKQLQKHPEIKEAFIEAQKEMFKPFILASITTIAAFLTLLIAHFKGFYEFGVVASFGVLFSMLSSYLVLPVIVFIAGGIPKAPDKSLLPVSWSETKIFSFFKRLAITGFILGVTSLFFAQYVDFEHNLQNLRREATEKKQLSGISTGVAQSSTRKAASPAAVMGSKMEQLDKLYDTLMIRLHKEKRQYLSSFLTLKTFVPSLEDQKERLEVVEEIKELVEARVFDKASGKDSSNIKALRDIATVERIFTAEDIPEWALDLLREKDGSYGKIGFIYGNYPSWDAKAVHQFQQDYGNWNFDGEKLRVFSSQFILSDVIESVKADSFKLAFLITIVIFASLAISLRKPALFATGFLSFAMGIVLTMGLMGFLVYFFEFGKISVYNVIVVPLVLGIGIDCSIHFIVSWTSSDKMTLRQLMDSTGRNVMASSATTIAGFTGMLFTAHKGLRGIGELADIGIFVFLIAGIVFSMFFCSIWLKKKNIPNTTWQNA
jgi:predicted RND superfamily exporter protein